jgi:hypothetical protein
LVIIVAEEVGLPLLPPYQAHNGSFVQGTNFAVAGATTINVEFFEKNNFVTFPLLRNSLDYQLAWFEVVKTSLCNSTQGISLLFFYLGRDWKLHLDQLGHPWFISSK